MADRLEPGERIVGWIVDHDEQEVEIPALLENTGEQIRLTVPWNEASDRTEPYPRWFAGTAVRYGDDPERTRFKYEVPSLLHFVHASGNLALVGCYSRGSRSNLLYSQGEASVQVAVLGGDGGNFLTIHGLRTQSPRLADWFGRPSMLTRKLRTDGVGRLKSVTLQLESPPPTQLHRRLNLCARPHFQMEQTRAGVTEIEEHLFLETRTKRARTWQEHVDVHNVLRDLVDIASWQPSTVQHMWALRDDRPERLQSGDPIGDNWAEVRTYAIRSGDSQSWARFLFNYSDIGARGVHRWFKLRETFTRGMGPLLEYFDNPQMPEAVLMVRASIGLEALGHELALEAGLSRKAAKAEEYAKRLRRIANEVTAVPPFSLSDWIDEAAKVYNGIKHANRSLPDRVTTRTTLWRSWLVFRLWVAARIGAPDSVIMRASSLDPLWRALVPPS